MSRFLEEGQPDRLHILPAAIVVKIWKGRIGGQAVKISRRRSAWTPKVASWAMAKVLIDLSPLQEGTAADSYER